MSGPIEVAKNVIREHVLQEGLCVTVEPTLFMYTGGEETGFVVGLLNYPKFPSTQEKITGRAKALMFDILAATFQHSGLIVTPETTEWFSNRSIPTCPPT